MLRRRAAGGRVNLGLMQIRAASTTPKLTESVSDAAVNPAKATSAPPIGPPIMETIWLPDCRSGERPRQARILDQLPRHRPGRSSAVLGKLIDDSTRPAAGPP